MYRFTSMRTFSGSTCLYLRSRADRSFSNCAVARSTSSPRVPESSAGSVSARLAFILPIQVILVAEADMMLPHPSLWTPLNIDEKSFSFI